MRKKLCKRFLGLALLGSLIVGSISACGSQTEVSKESTETQVKNSNQETSQSEIVQEEVTLTVAWVEKAAVTAHSADLSETAFGKAWQEATGINFEVVSMADGQAYSLLFASGDLPDIIWYGFGNYPAGPQAAIEDGIIEPLNDYMEYAPNLQAILDSNEDYREIVTTRSGDIIGFPWIRDDSVQGALAVQGIAIRQDWLDELGLDFPKTADEFYNVLKKFKEEKGAEYPLTTYNLSHFVNGAVGQGIITSPFGLVKGTFYQKDGKVHYGYAEQEYKDVLEWLNKLYDEGLLDPNFASIDGATFDSNMLSGISGVGFISCNTAHRLTSAAVEINPEFDLIGIPPLGTADGGLSMSTQYSYPTGGSYAVITPSCENKEAAVRFLDYLYSEEGTMLANFGIEGESYEVVDGVPKETELISNHPNGWSAQEVRAYYQLSWDSGPFVHLYIPESLPERTQITKTNFYTSDVEKYLMPQLYFSEEVSAEISKYLSEISTLQLEMFTKYIMGVESLDSFDNYVNTLYEMGLDKVLAYYQEELDAYNSK